MIRDHNLKCRPEFFDPVARGLKNFDVRKNDRDFVVGDFVVLHKYDMERGYIAVPPLRRRIIFVMDGGRFGIESGYVLLALGLEQEGAPAA